MSRPQKETATGCDVSLAGLTSVEVAVRFAAEGSNELEKSERRSIFRIASEVIREPMFALLLAGGIVYLTLGDLAEALLLLGFASLSVSITIVQESRSERVLESLRDLSAPRALVIRDGDQKRIPGREVVRGDVVILAEGDRVPADATLATAHDLVIDESLLTGESVPVRKAGVSGSSIPAARPGGDDLPFVYSGTLVVRGRGIATVSATGSRTEFGRIGGSLAKIETEPTRLNLETRHLIRWVASIGVALSILAIVLYGLLRGTWLDGLLGGIALSMSMLPEEFPLVLTVFTVMGAWRISRARVLTRRASAIESLGAATVLCTDKTGTLTQNRMQVAELRSEGIASFMQSDKVIPSPLDELAFCAVLASADHPSDPMDLAVHQLRDRIPDRLGRSLENLTLVKSYGLRPDLLAMTQVWSDGSPDLYLAAKGAPEAIAELAGLGAEALGRLRDDLDKMATRGLRVLAVARARYTSKALPESQREFAFEFMGLLGFSDPLRPGVPEAVAECRSGGIRVIMITGDYPATAKAIAAQAGLDATDALTGEALSSMDDAAFGRAVAGASIFARVMPEQKLRIVQTLKAQGQVVAMTGDGVNDAPSLKAANIGVAMGGRGTDVAREASAIVLLDDDFASLVHTVRLGRRIYDNLRKAFAYILAVHVPIAGVSLLPLALSWPVILGPLHIAFIEMVIDPVCSVIFEAEREESGIMSRPPRDPASPLISGAMAAWGLLQGFLALMVVGGVFVLGHFRQIPDDELRALVFVTLIVTNMGLILVNRNFSGTLLGGLRGATPALWIVLAVAPGLLLLAVTWPPAEALFRFGPLHFDDLSIAVAGGITVLILLGLAKRFWKKEFVS